MPHWTVKVPFALTYWVLLDAGHERTLLKATAEPLRAVKLLVNSYMLKRFAPPQYWEELPAQVERQFPRTPGTGALSAARLLSQKHWFPYSRPA